MVENIATMRPILLTGGAPRLPVDAVRHLIANATGDTAVALATAVRERRLKCDLLLGVDASTKVQATRYRSREELEQGLRTWIELHPDGVVVMAAAVNDYVPHQVEVVVDGTTIPVPFGHKVPSRAQEFVIRCKPATKLVDQLRGWGLTGPLVAFKHEAADTVIPAAQSLRVRVGASLVVANSLDGAVQALVDAVRVQQFPHRPAMLEALGERLVQLAGS